MFWLKSRAMDRKRARTDTPHTKPSMQRHKCSHCGHTESTRPNLNRHIRNSLECQAHSAEPVYHPESTPQKLNFACAASPGETPAADTVAEDIDIPMQAPEHALMEGIPAIPMRVPEEALMEIFKPYNVRHVLFLRGGVIMGLLANSVTVIIVRISEVCKIYIES